MFTICDDDTADSPWPMLKRLLASEPELADLNSMMEMGITVAILMKDGPMKLRGQSVLGICCQPKGSASPLSEFYMQLLEDTLGYIPSFMIILSAEFWREATPLQREALVMHEALHAGHAKDEYGTPRFNRESGEPVTCMVPHDLEEFAAIVRRYGAWEPGIERFLEAAAEHDKASQRPEVGGVF
jgi:hypothetical protein